MSARDRLLKAARDLFQRHGFHGVGLAEILEAAAATKGSLYHHFPDGKDALAAAAVADIAGEVCGYIEARVAAGAGGVAIAGEIAEMCAVRMRAEGFTWSPLVSAVGSLADLRSPRLAGALKQAYDGWTLRMTAAFRGQGLGDEDAGRAAAMSLLALEGAITLTRATGDDAPLNLVGPLLERFVVQKN